MNVRLTKLQDVAALQTVLDETGLFPSEMLPEMISNFLSDSDQSDVWLTYEDNNTAIGFCYAAPEQLTQGTWNMLAIAVLPSRQDNGVGAALVKELEEALRKRSGRILIVDTSGTDAFSQTRAFYEKNGYTQEARIRDFWAEGDDKIIFWKKL
jgi:ribosomal protein S18 acetylase RimI-like enzyme